MSRKTPTLPLNAYVTIKPAKLPALFRGVRARLDQGRIGQFVGFTQDGVPIVKWHGTSDTRKEFNEHYLDLDNWVDQVTDEAVIADYVAAVDAYRQLRADRRAAGDAKETS